MYSMTTTATAWESRSILACRPSASSECWIKSSNSAEDPKSYAQIMAAKSAALSSRVGLLSDASACCLSNLASQLRMPTWNVSIVPSDMSGWTSICPILSITRNELPLTGYGVTITNGPTWPTEVLPQFVSYHRPFNCCFQMQPQIGELRGEPGHAGLNVFREIAEKHTSFHFSCNRSGCLLSSSRDRWMILSKTDVNADRWLSDA